MSAHTYQGSTVGWLFLCREDLVLGVDVLSSDDRVPGLWALVQSGADSGRLLDVLAGDGVHAAPSSIMVERLAADAARILVRGHGQVRVDAGAEHGIVSGAGAEAWVEHAVPLASTIVCEVGAPSAAPSAHLPLTSGAVRAISMRAGFAIGAGRRLSADAESSPGGAAPYATAIAAVVAAEVAHDPRH